LERFTLIGKGRLRVFFRRAGGGAASGSSPAAWERGDAEAGSADARARLSPSLAPLSLAEDTEAVSEVVAIDSDEAYDMTNAQRVLPPSMIRDGRRRGRGRPSRSAKRGVRRLAQDPRVTPRAQMSALRLARRGRVCDTAASKVSTSPPFREGAWGSVRGVFSVIGWPDPRVWHVLDLVSKQNSKPWIDGLFYPNILWIGATWSRSRPTLPRRPVHATRSRSRTTGPHPPRKCPLSPSPRASPRTPASAPRRRCAAPRPQPPRLRMRPGLFRV